MVSKIEDFLLDELNKLADKSAHSDPENNEVYHFSAYDASGGNYDDAYYMGTEDGEIFLARSLLERIEKWDII